MIYKDTQDNDNEDGKENSMTCNGSKDENVDSNKDKLRYNSMDSAMKNTMEEGAERILVGKDPTYRIAPHPNQKSRKRMPIWGLILTDVGLSLLCMGIFLLYYYI
ncbi:MAG TPA: hypothetical protein VHP81_01135, partial [Lachnospiraceae bacterium]|nr:hypothetical protein [Lachnospiraceae bacterium]